MMAPRKQPIRLEESALKVVAKYCADTVINFLENCNAAEVESYIALVKDVVCADVPGILFNDFAAMFLQRISEVRGNCIQDWVKNYGTAVIDVVVDDRLTKLERYPRVADHLMHILYCNMDRLKNLRYLHFGRGEAEYLSNLKNCHLKYLTTFGCHHTCTDEVLRLIAERCPNLTTLDIEQSKKITSAGLDVLKQCPKLSMVKSKHCGIRSDELIIHLLSHDKIENIAHFIYNSENLMSFRAGVYHKLKSLLIDNVEITNAALNVIVRSFPSLDTLFLHDNRATGDLRLLRSLAHLTSLGIWCHHGYDMEQVESLLTEAGNNYSSLSILVDVSQLQRVVNFVYKTCKNIKYFRVAVWTGYGSRTITIPPFENLESLSVEIYHMWRESVHLQFTRLLALKKLHLNACCADLESILLDHNNFPCITEIGQIHSSLEKLEVIRNIIKENNFDVYYHKGY